MPDDDKHAAKIAGDIGDDDVRSGKDIVPEHKIADERRDTALGDIEKEIDEPHLEAELAAHVHGAGVAASDLMRILVFGARDDHGEIDAAEQIADDCHQQKPIPTLRKVQLFHEVPRTDQSSFLLRTWMRMGVPEKS